MKTRAKWPEWVPVITAADCCKRTYSDDRGRRCLVGHFQAALVRVLTAAEFPAYNRACDIAEQILGRKDLIYWNDKVATLDQIADVYNETMRRLGYTEIFDLGGGPR